MQKTAIFKCSITTCGDGWCLKNNSQGICCFSLGVRRLCALEYVVEG